MGRALAHCYECREYPSSCDAIAGTQLKARALGEFARRFGEEHLLDCLERNEAAGVIYHRDLNHLVITGMITDPPNLPLAATFRNYSLAAIPLSAFGNHGSWLASRRIIAKPS